MDNWEKAKSDYLFKLESSSFLEIDKFDYFMQGADFGRAYSQSENAGAMPLELVDRSRELLKKSYQKKIEQLTKENAKLKLKYDALVAVMAKHD